MSELQAAPNLRERLNGPALVPFRHIPPLDGIRGVGIIVVMFGHYAAGLSEYWDKRLFGMSLTIDLFFVLSGFLITSLLLEEWSRKGTISMRNFYVRRGLRLLPALAGLLGVVALVPLFTDWLPLKLTYAEIFAAAFYVYPALLVVKGDQAFLLHLWTLSIEEWFYFAWPALLAIVGLRPDSNRRLRLVTGSLIGFCALLAVVRVFGGPRREFFLLYGLRPDSLCYGALLAIFWRKYPDIRTATTDRWLRIVTGVGAIGFLYFDLIALYPVPPGPFDSQKFHNEAWTSWNYQLGIFCAVLLILHLVALPTGRVSRAMSWKAFIKIGGLSYGLYLWHQPIFLIANEQWYINHRDVMPPWVFGVLVGVASLVVAQISWVLIETPALKMKRRFEVVRPEPTK